MKKTRFTEEQIAFALRQAVNRLMKNKIIILACLALTACAQKPVYISPRQD